MLDLELGNIVKANRFGYVKRAIHGTAPLSYEDQRRIYARTIVDLAEPRWVFLNTFFSLSEGCMYAQLVDLLDRRLIPEAARLLAPRGWLIMEIGYALDQAVGAMLGAGSECRWTSVETRADLAGLPRVMCARRP